MDITMQMVAARLPKGIIKHEYYSDIEEFYCSLYHVGPLEICKPPYDDSKIYVTSMSELATRTNETWPNNLLCVDDGGKCQDIYPKWNLVIVSNELDCSELVHLVEQIFLEFNTIASRLTSAFLHDASLKELLDIVAAYLENPMRISSPFLRVLAQTDDDDIALLRYARTTGYLSTAPELVSHFIKFRKKAELSTKPYRENYPPVASLPDSFYVFPLRKTQWYGWIALLEHNRICDAADIGICSYFAEIASELLEKRSLVLRESNAYGDDVIQNILSNDKTDDEYYSRISSLTGLTEEYAYYVMVIGAKQGYILNRQQLDAIITDVSHHVMPDFTSVFDGRAVVLFSSSKYEVIRVDSERLESILFKANAIAAVSNRGVALNSLRREYGNAISTLELGHTVRADHALYFYDDLMLENFINECLKNPRLIGALSPCSAILCEHDRLNGSELDQTLRVLARHNFRQKSAADELYIHRSTLTYRMERIRELLNVDLDDPDTLLHIMLTYRILDSKA